MSAGTVQLVAVRRDPAVGAVAQHVARLGLADARGAGRGIRRRSAIRALADAGDRGRRGLHADAADRRRPRQRLVPEPDRPRADRLRCRLAGAVAARRRRRDGLRAASRRSPAMQAAWFFGANRAGEPMYDPATGITFDGLEPDGTINRNSGAESTIHGLLTMIALDARPELAARASSVTTIAERSGLRARRGRGGRRDGRHRSARRSRGRASRAGRGAPLTPRGRTARDLRHRRGRRAPLGRAGRLVEPEGEAARSTWTSERRPLGSLEESAPPQGISPTDGVLLPHSLQLPVVRGSTAGPRRCRERHAAAGRSAGAAVRLAPGAHRRGRRRPSSCTPAALTPQPIRVGRDGESATVVVYDASGAEVRTYDLRGARSVPVPSGGFAIVTG